MAAWFSSIRMTSKRRDCRVSNILRFDVKWHSGPVSLLAAVIAATKSQKGNAGPPWNWPVPPEQPLGTTVLVAVPFWTREVFLPRVEGEGCPAVTCPELGLCCPGVTTALNLGTAEERTLQHLPANSPAEMLQLCCEGSGVRGCVERLPPEQLPPHTPLQTKPTTLQSNSEQN